MRTVEIDAKGKVLGRLAGQIALALRGKDQPDFRPDRLAQVQVIVKNADQFSVTGAKRTTKMYYRFSGYPGGLKKAMLRDVKPEYALRQAVRRMLPNNRLRDRLMKHLVLDILQP